MTRAAILAILAFEIAVFGLLFQWRGAPVPPFCIWAPVGIVAGILIEACTRRPDRAHRDAVSVAAARGVTVKGYWPIVIQNLLLTAIFAAVAIFCNHWWVVLFSLLGWTTKFQALSGEGK